MGLEDVVGAAKDLVSKVPGGSDTVDGASDSAKGSIEEKTPDQLDGAVDQGAQALKDQL